MKTIALFGATGRTGSCVIKVATAAGIVVRALTRRKTSIPANSSVIEIVGSIINDEDVRQTLEGADAACLVFGPHPPYTEVFCKSATQIIVREMKQLGVNRVLCQTGAMIGNYPYNRSWIFEKMAGLYQHRNPEEYLDRLGQEEEVINCDLNWLLLKPPRLQDKQTNLAPIVGTDVRVGLMSSVSRVQVGNFLVEQILKPTMENDIVFIRG